MSSNWRVAVMDPPWKEVGGGKIKRGADRHYPLMTVDGIEAAVHGSGLWTPADDAHLFCWYTDNHLLDALDLVKRLGFRYVRTFVWVKLTKSGKLFRGLGQYARGSHEGMLFCVKGSGLSSDVYSGDRSLPSVIHAKHVVDTDGKIIHSAKPNAARHLIERRSLGPRVEFFARRAVPGWVCWGEDGIL